ncbi:MAG: glycine zipper family protein [Gammaproteobacteria bacterium]|nr:glycine zipper family protein [Gammaproteobacteria bacterium]
MHRILVAVATLGLAACYGTPGPIIDTQGVNMAQYEQDLADCEVYRDEVNTAAGVAKGTAAGAAVGGATGAITGRPGEAAGVGAIWGGARSAQLNDREKDRVVKNCLRGRGYRVLN